MNEALVRELLATIEQLLDILTHHIQLDRLRGQLAESHELVLRNVRQLVAVCQSQLPRSTPGDPA
jgi:hypothetical protein